MRNMRSATRFALREPVRKNAQTVKQSDCLTAPLKARKLRASLTPRSDVEERCVGEEERKLNVRMYCPGCWKCGVDGFLGVVFCC
jgi:hypothetical protein